MPLPNSITPLVRKTVNEWLADTSLSEFTVADVLTSIENNPGLKELVSACKSVSNELVRLETAHKLVSRMGVKGFDGCGVGRTPRVYRKNMIFRK